MTSNDHSISHLIGERDDHTSTSLAELLSEPLDPTPIPRHDSMWDIGPDQLGVVGRIHLSQLGDTYALDFHMRAGNGHWDEGTGFGSFGLSRQALITYAAVLQQLTGFPVLNTLVARLSGLTSTDMEEKK